MNLQWMPALNATLNGTSALLLLVGFVLIRRRKYRAHAATMVAALVSSSLFLISYVIYHTLRGEGPTRFPPGSVRPVYLFVLLTHTVLAIVILPMVLTAVVRALRGRFAMHARIARWTLPLWMYVSVTGVVIYWMLYHLAPQLR